MTKQERIEELEAQLKALTEQVEKIGDAQQVVAKLNEANTSLTAECIMLKHELTMAEKAHTDLQDRVAGMLGL